MSIFSIGLQLKSNHCKLVKFDNLAIFLTLLLFKFNHFKLINFDNSSIFNLYIDELSLKTL